mgnify:FL=1
MKRFLIVSCLILVILIGGGYAIFAYVKNVASEQMLDYVNEELDNSEQLTDIQEVIQSDAKLQSFIAEGEHSLEQELPFKTKEEAAKVIINKVGLNDLQTIYSQVQERNVSTEEVIEILESHLTEEEIQALKAIAYQEIYK